MDLRLPARSIPGILLALLAIARLAAVVLHDPMLGIANQHDMVRTGACVGLYPDLPEASRLKATPDAPIVGYKLGSRVPDSCYPGTEAAIAGAVVLKQRLTGKQGAAFPALREVGLVKLAIAALAILAIAAALRNYPVASLLHGAVALFVMADPVVSLWFQTLYTEFPVIFGLYLLVGALAAGLLREWLAPWLACLAVAGVVMAAFAKEQFFLLPLALVAVAAPRLWPSSRPAVVAVAVVAASAIAWHALVPRSESIGHANRVNTYLGLLLPASSNPAATLTTLGLTSRCGELSGASWYLRRGEDVQGACPEVLHLSSSAFLRLVPSEPETLARAVARALPTMQDPLPGNLGVVAGGKRASLDAQPLRVHSLLAPASLLVPAPWYLGLAILGLALLVPALVGWAATLLRGPNAEAHPFAAFALMLVLIAGYALATTVFGDGLSESARHNLPGFLALAALALALLFALVQLRRVGLGLRVLLAIAFLAAVAGTLAAAQWALRQPNAIGTLDEPATGEVPRTGFTLRGWALDPSGVNAIRITAGRQVATVGRDAFTASPELARVYGGYPGARRANFRFDVPAAWLEQSEVQLRVETENARGVVTEIDRRRLRPSP